VVCDLTGIREPVSVGQVLKLVHVFMLLSSKYEGRPHRGTSRQLTRAFSRGVASEAAAHAPGRRSRNRSLW
jgi:hypothetical protein